MDLPIFKTKKEPYKNFDLTDVNQRKEYFEYKAGPEIKKIKDYLSRNSFVAYLLGKKSSGKGTYSKMFGEIFGEDKVTHFSIGDMVRNLDKTLQSPERKQELIAFLQKNYRGFLSLEKIIESLENRSTKILLPSELILTLAKKRISELGKKSIFIDGFPRDLDQISYSLFFRDLIGYRQDPDIFILIDVPNTVIDARIKNRVICPICQTSRSLKLLPTKYVAFDQATKSFYLLCDNPDCPSYVQNGQRARLVRKEGDERGLEPIKERLEKDAILLQKAMDLYGIPKIFLRNSVPAKDSDEHFDDYELTPEYFFSAKGGPASGWEITTHQKPWEVEDDQGVASHSLTPPPVVVSLIKQLAQIIEQW